MSQLDVNAQIDSLTVSEGLKKKLHLVNEHLKGVKFGFPEYSLKGFALLKMQSIWAFFFCVIYYFIKGMWRKGLVFLLIAVILTIAEELLIPNSNFGKFLNLIIPVICMQCAYHDLYRKLVKKETFWW